MLTGLTTEQARSLLKQHGKNTIITKKRFSAIELFLSQFPSLINGILIAAGVFSLLIGHTLDGFFIFAVILLNAVLGFVQEYRAEKSLEKLQSYTKPEARVIRDGKEQEVLASELVPGDIVILSEGDRIQADGTLSDVRHLEVDEAILTGESLPVIKSMQDEVFRGTLVTKGRAKLRVVKTGMQTRFGQIAQSLATIQTDKTPLQKQLVSLGKLLTALAVGIAVLIIPVGLIQGGDFVELALIAASVGVAAVPEGLPAVITIALAVGTSRMARRNAIARKMPAIETLGSVQILLVDKTGTLTRNEMRVKKVWLKEQTTQDALFRACLLGNTASLAKTGGGELEIVGDRTDGALLLWATQQKAKAKIVLAGGTIKDEYVFDTKTKTITTVWEKDGKKHVFVRGAPEAILERSILTATKRAAIEKTFEEYASEGLRVIAFGTKIEKHHGALNRDHIESKLQFLGVVGIYDPPRAEVKDAIQKAKQAGIQTIMVTGDNELTALAIGKEIGLIDKNDDVLTGKELAELSDEELKRALRKTHIFARTKPEDKLRVTKLFQSMGHVVGVTGDGVNDSLALKKADVGLAMGESGTDVAKESSDIILADDNFATIVKAVEEGRTIYKNIVKAITYLLSGNLSELLLVLVATMFGLPAPLLTTQILWINLVTDGLPALALASDTSSPEVLTEKPRDRKEQILTRERFLFIGMVGAILTVLLLLLYVIMLNVSSQLIARTVVFNALIFSHLIVAFILRGQSILRPNKFLIGSVILTIILQIIITTTPFFQELFEIGFS